MEKRRQLPRTPGRSAAPSATPKPTKTEATKPIPNVVSKPFIEARGTLNAEGYYARIVDKGGKKWTNIVPDETVVVVSTSPAAGGVSDDNFVDIVVDFTEAEYIAASQAKADAAKSARPLYVHLRQLQQHATR